MNTENDAVLFELIGPSGERWSLHLDGQIDGFPAGTTVINHAKPLFDRFSHGVNVKEDTELMYLALQQAQIK